MYKRGNEEINWTLFLESFTNDTWICIGFTFLGLWVFVTCILYFSNKVGIIFEIIYKIIVVSYSHFENVSF